MAFLLLFFLLFVLGECCEPIREPLCQTGIAYNMTIFPNLAGHLFQGGAAVGLQSIRVLIDRQCSPNIREFLCRVYMPECRNNQAVLPSWEMCQEAFEGCDSLMSSIGHSWAFSLNCTKFEASTIDAIKKKAQDKSAFWFGTGVNSLCSSAHHTLACEKNARAGHTDSIVSRFGGNLDVSGVDRLIQINYTYSSGVVKSCYNDFTMAGGSFQVDPLSPKVHHSWEVRSLPSITWSARSSQYFTLILYDVWTMNANAIYTNIPGNDVKRGDIVMDYKTPLNPTEVATPYVFLLYEQNGRISSSQSLSGDPVTAIHSSSSFRGLKAISWVLIEQDPYSINELLKSQIVNNCPSLLTKAIQDNKQPFIPADLTLEMSVDVTYTPSSITFTSCCKTYHYHEKSFEVNALGNEIVKTAHVRSSATPSVTLTRRDWAPNLFNFSGNELYTLVLLDPYATSGNRSRPFVHWMVLDIPHGNVDDGVTAREYKGPQPSSISGVHTYYFILYQQVSRINATSLTSYSSPCSRCYFDINKFVTDNHLTIIGANWMRGQNDEYIRHLNVDEGTTTMAQECAGQPDYPSACASGAFRPQEIIG